MKSESTAAQGQAAGQTRGRQSVAYRTAATIAVLALVTLIAIEAPRSVVGPDPVSASADPAEPGRFQAPASLEERFRREAIAAAPHTADQA